MAVAHPTLVVSVRSPSTSARTARSNGSCDAAPRASIAESESVLLGRRDALHVWVSPAEELAPVGGRVHLDVRLDRPADLDRLAALGAVPCWQDPQGRWRVYADAEGNLFCAVTGWTTELHST